MYKRYKVCAQDYQKGLANFDVFVRTDYTRLPELFSEEREPIEKRHQLRPRTMISPIQTTITRKDRTSSPYVGLLWGKQGRSFEVKAANTSGESVASARDVGNKAKLLPLCCGFGLGFGNSERSSLCNLWSCCSISFVYLFSLFFLTKGYYKGAGLFIHLFWRFDLF